MKNTKIFPFERNQYYYGKLLSVDDFNLEQKYNCNKQRMNHMFLSGFGIMAGMYVVSVGEQTISVESGCALDAFGREVVIDVPVIKKLQMIDGFEQAASRGENYIYLCLEYAEKPTDAVYNIAGNIGSEESTYNKVTESYRLFLSNREPEFNGTEADELLNDSHQLYFHKGISIRQSFPRYVEIGKKVVVTVDIETTEKSFVAFSYTMNLNGLTYEKENSLTINFDELMVEKTGNYQLSFELDPVPTKGYEASAAMEPGSFKMVIDKKQRETTSNHKYTVEIVEGDIQEKIIEDYYRCSMDTMMDKARQKCIYLAKIYLMKTENTYLIDRVVNAPFKQYVMNQQLLGTFAKIMRKDIRNLEFLISNKHKKDAFENEKNQDSSEIQIAGGVYEMEFGLRGDNRRKFFSPPIVHGLGLGYVTIILSQETRKNEAVFGNAEIFQESYVDVDLAAQLDEAAGSFIIGAKLKETVAKNSIRIQWTAIRRREEKSEEKLERHINIKPGMLELYTRESSYLEVSFSNMEDKQIRWQLKEGAGTIDETNVYTAPNERGVYEICAQSVAYPDVKASVFAVVRERK